MFKVSNFNDGSLLPVGEFVKIFVVVIAHIHYIQIFHRCIYCMTELPEHTLRAIRIAANCDGQIWGEICMGGFQRNKIWDEINN